MEPYESDSERTETKSQAPGPKVTTQQAVSSCVVERSSGREFEALRDEKQSECPKRVSKFRQMRRNA